MSTLKVNAITNVDGSAFRANTDVVKLQAATGADLGAALIFDDLAFSIFSLDIYKASSKSVTGDFI